MTCKFHGIPIGTKLIVDRFMCIPCGSISDCRGVVWTYLGEESPYVHIVNPDTPIKCQNCGHVSKNGRVPCGQGGAFEIIAYPAKEIVGASR